MNARFFTVVAALCLAACNPDRGPEYTTPAEFGEMSVSPQAVVSEMEIAVKVPVSCQYGFRSVYIAYWFDDDVGDVDYSMRTNPGKNITSFTYEGTISWKSGARKVTFQVWAISAYNVPSYTQSRSYTIPDEEDEEDEQPEQPN